MSEAVKCRQGMLGMDLSELSCAVGLTLIVSSSALEESI
jgi:hypothetical protein